MGYKIDIAPGRQSLIFEYVDAPGRMGTIGTILGEAGINITTMQIGAKPADRCALVYMNVEGEVDDAVLATPARRDPRAEEPLVREAVAIPCPQQRGGERGPAHHGDVPGKR